MNIDCKTDTANLRKKAEAFLKKNPTGSGLELSEADMLKLIHEFDICKIELEMQQDELLQAKELADSATLKYNELFDTHNRFIMHLLKNGNSLK